MNNQNNKPHIVEFLTQNPTAETLWKSTKIFKDTIQNKKNEFNYYKYEVINPDINGNDILIDEFGFMRFEKYQIKKINKLIKKGFNKCLFIPDRDNKGNLEDISLFHSINNNINEQRKKGGSVEIIKNIKSGYKYESKEYLEYIKNKQETNTIYNESDEEEEEKTPTQYIKILENTNIYFYKDFNNDIKELFNFVLNFFSQDSILIMEFKKTLDPPPFTKNKQLLFILEYDPLPLQYNTYNQYYKNIFLDGEDLQKEAYKYYYNNDIKKFNYIDNVEKIEKNLIINKILDINLKNVDCENILKKHIKYNEKYNHKKEHQNIFNMCLFELNFIKNGLDGETYKELNKITENKQYLKNGYNGMIKKGLLTPFKNYNNTDYIIDYDDIIRNYNYVNILRCYKFLDYKINTGYNDFLNINTYILNQTKKYRSLRHYNNIRRIYFNLPLISL